MYVSPAVRALVDHPADGEPVRLRVRCEDADGGVVEDAVREAGGTVAGSLQFGGRAVVVDQDRLGDLLAALEAASVPVAAVETADVASPGDAGEDVGDLQGE